LEEGDLTRVGAGLFNRLEATSFGLAPAVAELKRRLAEWTNLGALMSGSGSAVFALAESRNAAERIARQASDAKLGAVFVASSCD
jgi:4-diphosphocytidyl-2-C-methyl-D-erythritol kinase